MLKQKFLFLLLLVLLSSFLFAQKTFAAQIITSPKVVNYGDPVTVTLDQLDVNAFYRLTLTFKSDCTSPLQGANITTSSNGACKVDSPGSDMWSQLSCPSVFTGFTGTIDTKKLGIDPNDSADTTWQVCEIPDGGQLAKDQFTVKSNNPSAAAFNIDHIFNHDGSTNSESNPADPGSEIGIKLKNAKPGSYGVKIGDDKIQSSDCPSSDCAVYGTVRSDINSPTVQVVVADSNDHTQTAVAYLKSTITNSNPITPAPTDTPPPPLPPCSETLKNTAGEVLGCKAVWSGLGVDLATNPSQFIATIFGVLLSISGGFAVLLIIRSGYQMMTSAGNAEAVKEARDRITSAIIGLLFLIFSLVILEVIGVDILHIPGLSH